MFTFVMDVIIVVLKSVMIFLPRRWFSIVYAVFQDKNAIFAV